VSRSSFPKDRLLTVHVNNGTILLEVRHADAITQILRLVQSFESGPALLGKLGVDQIGSLLGAMTKLDSHVFVGINISCGCPTPDGLAVFARPGILLFVLRYQCIPGLYSMLDGLVRWYWKCVRAGDRRRERKNGHYYVRDKIPF